MTDISGEVGGNDNSGSASPRRHCVDTIRVEATAMIGEVGGDERGQPYPKCTDDGSTQRILFQRSRLCVCILLLLLIFLPPRETVWPSSKVLGW